MISSESPAEEAEPEPVIEEPETPEANAEPEAALDAPTEVSEDEQAEPDVTDEE